MPIDSKSKKLFGAIVSSVKKTASDIVEVTFKLNDQFQFTSGQYVWVELPNLIKPDPKGNRRAFSICSIPSSENSISIIGRLSESGYKQTLFALKEGETVIIHGPFGSLNFPTGTDPVVCIAGGVGIAPFLSLIPDSLTRNPERKVTLLYATKKEETGIYVTFFQSLQKSNPNFSLIETKGKITAESINQIHSSQPSSVWIVIGSKSMVFFVAETLYKSGVKEENIIFEEFFVSKNLALGTVSQTDLTDLSDIFSIAMKQSSNHVILTDIDGYITFANTAAEHTTGYQFSEMNGQTPRLWGGMESPEFYKNLWNTIKTERKSFTAEIRNRKKNGEVYYVIAHISPFTDKAGNLMGFMGTEEDVTKSTELTESIKKEKTEYQALLSSIGDGIIATDSIGNITIMNHAAEKILGLGKEEVFGKRATEAIPVVDAKGNPIPENLRPINKALSERKSFSTSAENDYYLIKKDGTLIPVALNASPVMVDDHLTGTIDVFRDISHQKNVDRMKTEFVSLASHQLRTPLTAIKWGLESLAENETKNLSDKQKGNLDDINNSTLRMIDLVNSLLNVSRIESGRIIVSPIPTNIVKLANDVIGKLKMEIVKKGISVVMNVGDNVPEINLDQSLIFNVYQNLISNAVSYSPAGSIVTISISVKNGEVISSVQDQGIGIPENEKAKIYEKFYRASNAKTVRPDGTGLGLYIVKSIVESSGGKLWFESIEGQGTTFYFTLPLTGMKAEKGEVSLS